MTSKSLFLEYFKPKVIIESLRIVKLLLKFNKKKIHTLSVIVELV